MEDIVKDIYGKVSGGIGVGGGGGGGIGMELKNSIWDSPFNWDLTLADVVQTKL